MKKYIIRLLSQSATPKQHESNTCPKCEGTGVDLKNYAYELTPSGMAPFHPVCPLCHGKKTVNVVAKIGQPIGIPIVA